MGNFFRSVVGLSQDRFNHSGPTPSLKDLSAYLTSLQEKMGEIQKITRSQESLPFGRYLIHQDSRKAFNIQLDVFSKNYVGLPHCHETWGVFLVLQGRLKVTNWGVNDELMPSSPASESLMLPGSGSVFMPPLSDWHEVRVEEPSEQVLSIHVYGPNFNLEEGIYRSPEGGIKSTRRGPLRSMLELGIHMETQKGF